MGKEFNLIFLSLQSQSKWFYTFLVTYHRLLGNFKSNGEDHPLNIQSNT